MKAIEKSETLNEAVVRAVHEVGFTLPARGTVFIKIDVGGDSDGLVTNLAIVLTLVNVAKVAGAGKVVVGGYLGIETEESAKLLAAVKTSGAEFVNLAQGPFTKVKPPAAAHWRGGFRLHTLLVSADAVILAPKVAIDQTYGLKGVLTSGIDTLSSGSRRRLQLFGHKVERAVEIQSAIEPTLVISDLSEVSVAGSKFVLNTVIASDNRLEADLEAVRILSHYGAKFPEPPTDLPIIAYADSVGIDGGTSNIGLVS